MNVVAATLLAALLSAEAPAPAAPQIVSRLDVQLDLINVGDYPVPTLVYALGISVAARRDFLEHLYAGGRVHLLTRWGTFQGDPNLRGDLEVAAGVAWPARRSWQFSVGLLGGVRFGYIAGTVEWKGGEYTASVSNFGARPILKATIDYRQLLTRNFGLTLTLQLPLHEFRYMYLDGDTPLLGLGVAWTFP